MAEVAALFQDDDVVPEPGQQGAAPAAGAQPVTPLADQSWEAARLAAAKQEEVDEGTKADAAKPAEEPGQPSTPPETPPGTPAAAAPAAAPQDQAGQPKPEGEKPTGPMIPKPAFDERIQKERAETQKAREAAAYWKGRAEAAPAAGAPAGQPQAAQKTPDQVIAEAKAEKVAQAKRYDDGLMTTAEWEQKRQDLDDKIFEARQAMIQVSMQNSIPAAKPGTSEDLYMDEMVSKLEREHPFCFEIPNDDPKWGILTDLARSELLAEGVPVAPGVRGDYQLKERIAKLTDVWGPRWTGKTLDQVRAERGLAPSTTTQPAQGQQPKPPAAPGGGAPKPKLSPAAQQRADKIAQAGTHPPDIHAIGTQGQVDEVTEDDILGMTQDQIMALPVSVRRKIMPLG